MKTVGEFKRAGLVFVEGDERSSIHKGHGNVQMTNEMAFGTNIDTKTDCETVISFAWRENTGVKPEFSGHKELELKNGEIKLTSTFVAEDNEDWSITGDGTDIIKWRPSLNQPSVAEHDSKESEIHKAWVALKGDLSNAKQYDENGSYLAVCIKDGFFIKEGLCCLTESLVENTEHWKDVCTVKEFTSYCEKMAAEEKRIDIIGQNGNDGLHYDNTAQQVEALAVNNKPIFTQAMSDAGEKVKVGMEFSTATGNYVALLVNENTVVFEHEELGFVVENHIFIHPVDAITDREKAIDDAMLKIGCHPSQDFIAGAPFIIGKLFDAELLNTKVS